MFGGKSNVEKWSRRVLCRQEHNSNILLCTARTAAVEHASYEMIVIENH